MEKSYVVRFMVALLYAPVGALGFLRDNAPTFFSMFVSRGKRDVTKTTMSAEEKLSTTKEHGQFVAMGTPLMRTRAEKLTAEAKSRGEALAHTSLDLALGTLNFMENAVKALASTVAGYQEKDSQTSTAAPEASTETQERSAHIHASSIAESMTHDISAPSVVTPSTYESDSSFFSQGEGEFIAEPLHKVLPANLQGVYERLSAPEIIDRLDEFARDDLANIRSYEADFRNRQTIIHAINYRLDENP